MELENLVRDAATRSLSAEERAALAAALVTAEEVNVSELEVLAALGGGRQQATAEESAQLLERALAQARPPPRRQWMLAAAAMAAMVLLSLGLWARPRVSSERLKSGARQTTLFMVAQRPGEAVGHTVTSPVVLAGDEVVRLLLRQTEPGFVGLYEERDGVLETVWSGQTQAGDVPLGPDGQGFRPDQLGVTRYWVITSGEPLPARLDSAQCAGCEAQLIELRR